MTFELVRAIPGAAWLPAGSAAEMWAGVGPAPEPAIIVRLLLVRETAVGQELFCVPTAKGDDLPTRFLGRGAERVTAAEGLAALSRETLGVEVPTTCIGYVRNHVPAPDADYPHPTPDAFVPVFRADDACEPTVEGVWRALRGGDDLEPRHWFPIVQKLLG